MHYKSEIIPIERFTKVDGTKDGVTIYEASAKEIKENYNCVGVLYLYDRKNKRTFYAFRMYNNYDDSEFISTTDDYYYCLFRLVKD